MLPTDNEDSLFPSLVDRLIDDDSQIRHEARQTPRETVDQIIESIIQDVCNLLNTRAQVVSCPEHHRELHDSVLSYGLPDFSGIAQRGEFQLQDAVSAVVSRHDSRLHELVIKVVPVPDSVDQRVRLQIRASVGTLPESVVFHVDLDESAETFQNEGSVE